MLLFFCRVPIQNKKHRRCRQKSLKYAPRRRTHADLSCSSLAARKQKQIPSSNLRTTFNIGKISVFYAWNPVLFQKAFAFFSLISFQPANVCSWAWKTVPWPCMLKTVSVLMIWRRSSVKTKTIVIFTEKIYYCYPIYWLASIVVDSEWVDEDPSGRKTFGSQCGSFAEKWQRIFSIWISTQDGYFRIKVRENIKLMFI